jgi:hypothetical protein
MKDDGSLMISGAAPPITEMALGGKSSFIHNPSSIFNDMGLRL